MYAAYSAHPNNTAGSLPASTPPLDFLPYRVWPCAARWPTVVRTTIPQRIFCI